MEAALEQTRLPDNVVPVTYYIHYDDIDLKKWVFSGTVDVDLEVKKETSFIMLNAKELSIASASVTAGGVTTEIEEFTVYKSKERVVFHLATPMKEGSIRLHVAFAGILNDYLQGFYRSKYIVDGEERYMATTQFESTDARQAFPCWDEPALKAKFNIFLTTPVGFTAVSNMPIVRKDTIQKNGVTKNVFQFAETPIMSTYLIAFVVGEFDKVTGYTKEGVEVNCYTPLGKSSSGEFALKVALHAISYYSDFFHVGYPLKKMDLMPIPDFAAGAMENWGCVTFREVDLMIDEHLATVANKHRVALVVSHEIAHMWFGDLVTMEWWTHLWLNEGFASYMEYCCVDDLFPEWHMFTEFYNDSFCTAFYDDALPSTHPIEVKVDHPDEIDQIFDGISYNKGSSVIHMLASFIGRDAFRKGMEIYLNRHRYQNACTEDLWRALQEGSGIDCEAIMKKWTQEPGYPLLRIACDGGKISSSQQRFFSNPAVPTAASAWRIPLTIVTPSGVTPFLYQEETAEAFDRLLEAKMAEKWVKVNQNALCLVQYPPTLLAKLKAAVAAGELAPLDRIQLLKDLKRLCNAQMVAPDVVLDFMQAYKDDSDPSVVEVLTTLLLSFFHFVPEDDAALKAKFQAFALSLMEKAYARCGWDAAEGESTEMTSARPQILRVMCSLCEEPVAVQEALRRYHAFMKDHDEKACHPEIRALCLAQGLRACSEAEAKQAMAQLMALYQETTGVEKRRILSALGQSQYPSLLYAVLNFSLDGTIRKQDTYQAFACVCRNRKHSKLCWEYLREHLGDLRESLKKSFNMLGYFVEAGGSVLDTEAEYQQFKAFFALPENQLKEVSRSIDIAEQTILLNISMKENMERRLKEYFA
ncbi:metallopeptidase M1 [Blastocystis sp. ATCC 50177/Nand II]|uniref:Aminopeptidase n=1 Tax=Blastocystis sp. subtype 1 (strain ATCC 50177 / NandII) TaxID=478820 RepID=A0A196S5P5_BLAHN|nr:metallopeptidase M1 [Blastocystis sp. ATCC 50177/Nand II]